MGAIREILTLIKTQHLYLHAIKEKETELLTNKAIAELDNLESGLNQIRIEADNLLKKSR